MRSDLRTPFWRAALRSLPETVQSLHAKDIERAERLELALDSVIEAYSRAKSAVAKLFNINTKAHSH